MIGFVLQRILVLSGSSFDGANERRRGGQAIFLPGLLGYKKHEFWSTLSGVCGIFSSEALVS